MSFEETIESIVRRVVREELKGAGRTEAPPELVSVGHVRRYIEVSASTVKKWIKAGDLVPHGQGRLTRVKLDDVRALLQRRAAPPAPSSQASRILASVGGHR